MNTRVNQSQTRRRRPRWPLPVVLAVIVILVAVLVWVVYGLVSGESPASTGSQSEQVQSQHSETEPELSQSGLGISDVVTVAGKFGAQPVVEVSTPVTLGSMKVSSVISGEGRRIESGTPVLTQVYYFSGEDGAPVGQSEFVIGHATPGELGRDLAEIVVGEREGSRLLVARPKDNGTCELVVVDILSTIATGEEVSDSVGPLTVEIDDESPRIKHKKTEPQTLVVQTLIRGEGPQIQLGDQVLLHYVLARWNDDTLVASSWAEGLPVIHSLDDLWPGLVHALVDQRVGSRLAVTIPPDQANGEDTIVAVVDILGTVHSADQ